MVSKRIRFIIFFTLNINVVKDNVLNFPVPKAAELSERLDRIDLETIVDVLSVRAEEERIRPEVTDIFGRIPSLLADYLLLNERNKQKIDRTRLKYPDYLNGEGSSYDINYLASVGNKSSALLARKCRWTYQLLKFYEFYKEHGEGKRFNQHYITHDPELKEVYGNAGYNLVQNIRKSYEISMEIIVELAGEVEPKICTAYLAPGESIKPKNIRQLIKK